MYERGAGRVYITHKVFPVKRKNIKLGITLTNDNKKVQIVLLIYAVIQPAVRIVIPVLTARKFT